MCYLTVSVKESGADIFSGSDKYDYAFCWREISVKTCLDILTEISRDFPGIKGGVITGMRVPDYPAFCAELAGNAIIDLEKSFSEIFNVPFIAQQGTIVLTESDLAQALQQKYEQLCWNIDYSGFTAGKEEYAAESLLTTANGYLGVRGALPDMRAGDAAYPATYLAGCYNRAESDVAGNTVSNEDFVNVPDARSVRIKIGDGEWLSPENCRNKVLYRNLCLKTGVLTQTWVAEDSRKHLIQINSRMLADMSCPERFAVEYSFTPLNVDAEITVATCIDGTTRNYGVERYRSLTSDHYRVLSRGAEGRYTQLNARTLQSGIGIGVTAKISGDFFTDSDIQIKESPDKVQQLITCHAKKGKTYRLAKSINIRLSSVFPDNWADADKTTLADFAVQAEASEQAWKNLWDKADIVIDGDLMSQKLLRLHICHLLSSCSPYSNGKYKLDVSVTARGLHGEAYRGHIFWDEIFILPFYIMHFPQTARQLLMYRYNRLPEARKIAQDSGCQGAVYPWQSGLDGSEQTQSVHLNPLNGHWDPDYSHLQRHVSLAVAYNIWLYWKNTGDAEFMRLYGMEMLTDIARFWLSKAEYDEVTGRYSVSGVMGPDEFHEHISGSSAAGLKDNAYTNMMISWLFSVLAELYPQFHTGGEDTAFIREIRHAGQHLALVIDDDVIAQFDGYFSLKEIDWEHYKNKYGNIYRMDRILRAEGKSADNYKVAKQADTLMIFNNFSRDDVTGILNNMGYHLGRDYAQTNLHYYLKRTSHGSTLSRVVHAQLACDTGLHDLSRELYQQALRSDYGDIQGGTTAEGIHTGVMAATINTAVMSYAGVDIRGDRLSVSPSLPAEWKRIRFNLQHRGVHYYFLISPASVSVTADKEACIDIDNETHQITAGTPFSYHYVKEYTS